MVADIAGGPDHAPKVLVVEDNRPMRDFICGIVHAITPFVHECDNGEAAVQHYLRLRPDLVVMDIRMRGIDGIAAARTIRSFDPAARIVLVTEHDDDRYRRAALEAGACGFLRKERLLELPELLRSVAGQPMYDVADPL
jgi:CheY-like chemotaxis protein